MALHDHEVSAIATPLSFGRLRKVVERGTSPAVLVAEYRYNALNQRITAHFDTDADGNIDGDDPVTHFAYDSRWRIVARFEDSNTDPMGPSFPVGETRHALHAGWPVRDSTC